MKTSASHVILTVSCALLLGACGGILSGDTDDTTGDSNYGVLTVSERSALVPGGWMPAGNMSFQVQNHYQVTASSIELGLAENATRKTSIIVGLGKSYSCVSGGSFCVVSATTGHPAISITIIDTGSPGMGQYRGTSGTVHIENLDPLVVRFERIYMTPEPYAGNGASGSFYLEGKLYAQKQ